MIPAFDYEEIVRHLSTHLKPGNNVRMVGIVFAPPNSPLAKAEIIPQLSDWHHRSGNHIDFFFAGYTFYHPPGGEYIDVHAPGWANPWLYSSKRFEALRQAIVSRTSWQYSGECELILANARARVDASNAAEIDFNTTITCDLNTMISGHAIQSVGQFFQRIFHFAETSKDNDPTWGFSDSQGLTIGVSALKRMVLTFLPGNLSEEYKKAEHFVVRNISRR